MDALRDRAGNRHGPMTYYRHDTGIADDVGPVTVLYRYDAATSDYSRFNGYYFDPDPDGGRMVLSGDADAIPLSKIGRLIDLAWVRARRRDRRTDDAAKRTADG